MKKILFVFLTLFAFASLKANEVGHFYVDLSSQSISISNISNSFSNYVDVANGSTFTLFRDTTDGLGIRHQSYQQYYQSKKVQSFVVLVHSKNGIVRSINGAVMTNSSVPQSAPHRISRRQAAEKASVQVEDSTLSTVIICIDGVFYNVYKVPSPKTYETLYVDVVTGEIVYRESAFRNADVTGRGYTRYSGWQNMTVYEQDGKYFLIDEGRNMLTMSAESAGPNTAYYMSESYLMNALPSEILENYSNLSPEEVQEIAYQYIMTPMMSDYIQNTCVTLYSNETDLYTPRIKSITISSAASSWWYDIWDTKPDLYCKICDPDGNVLYTTSTKDDCSLPVTFNFNTGIAVAEGCIIKIYDEDATSDSYGGSGTLTSVTPGTKTWSGSNTSGSIVIIDSPTEYADIHWGMQKTLDFYQNSFSRNSFDGKGHAVINLAFPPYDDKVFVNMPNNAAAQHEFEPYYMFYGPGDGSLMNPVVSLDVMAHEFTHMVTGSNGNGGLDYRGESGALNESFSDIMAMGVMQYTYGSCPWTIGASVMVSAPNMRSMSNPKNSRGANGVSANGAQPDTYYGSCWEPTSNPSEDNDNGGVHTNSGVQNYWFYLLSQGGNGTNDNNQSYSVSGIGLNKATQIAFRNLIFYLAPCATFEDSRNGSVQAAIDLYGKGSQEHQAVENAWHAVGVGNKYGEEQEPVTIKAQMPSNWGTTISAWVWVDGSEGSWATLTKRGNWYSYTSTVSPLNIVFVNGTTWNGDNNQSVDIRLAESTCIQLGTNSGKRTYTIVDCPEEAERYIVVAQRNSSSNWFYMTSDLGTASNKRYQAVDAGTNALANVTSSGLDDKFYWEIEGNKLKTAAGYSTWTSGNTANLNSTGKELTIQKQSNGKYTFSFADGSNTRYLALNKTAGNDYFAYYSGTNQIYQLTLIKEGESGSATAIEDVQYTEPQSATKVLIDGQLYILRGEHVYDIQGRLVK